MRINETTTCEDAIRFEETREIRLHNSSIYSFKKQSKRILFEMLNIFWPRNLHEPFLLKEAWFQQKEKGRFPYLVSVTMEKSRGIVG